MGAQPSVFVAVANSDNKDENTLKNGQHYADVFRQNNAQEDCNCWCFNLMDHRGRAINTSRHLNGSSHHHHHAATTAAAATHEILGTPMPDTPVTTRSRHRQQEATMSSPVRSGFYGFGTKKAGSESETNAPRGGGSFRSVLAGLPVSSQQQQSRLKANMAKNSRVDHNLPQIHDGPVRGYYYYSEETIVSLMDDASSNNVVGCNLVCSSLLPHCMNRNLYSS